MAIVVATMGCGPWGRWLGTGLDIDRLDLVRKMKPLGFRFDEMRALLTVLDPPETTPSRPPSSTRGPPPVLRDRRTTVHRTARQSSRWPKYLPPPANVTQPRHPSGTGTR